MSINYKTATADQILADSKAAALQYAETRTTSYYAHLTGSLSVDIKYLVAERDRLQRLLYPIPGPSLDDGDCEREDWQCPRLDCFGPVGHGPIRGE